MMIARPFGAGLGLIPDWQFSSDPNINILINPHVKVPSDWPMGQRTVQPIGVLSQRTYGDPLAATDGLTQMNGLGITMANWHTPRADLGALGLFDSWAWTHRKWLVIGGLGLIGLGLLSSVGAILR